MTVGCQELRPLIEFARKERELKMKAVVFVDVQNDFVKGGKLEFGYPVEDNLQKVVDFAKKCVNDPDCKIYATRDTHEATKSIYHFEGDKMISDPQSGYLATLEGKKLPVEHCVEGTEGWQIVDKLMETLYGKCTFINKPTFGSYDLVAIMAEDFETVPDEIIICGYDLGICILANAVLLRAKYPNTKIVVRTDLCGCVNEDTFKATCEVLKLQQIELSEG